MLHIVDDQDEVRDALLWLARSCAIAAQAHPHAQAWLNWLEAQPDPFDAQGDCLLLDVRMPGLSGLALFDLLNARGLCARIPVIFLTGHGDVPMAVDALKRGAFDFFEKPFNDNKLMTRVQEAFAASRIAAQHALVAARLASLSPREKEVLDLILQGKMNKVVADELGISMRTVEVHRANIFDKMQVKTAVELAGLLRS